MLKLRQLIGWTIVAIGGGDLITPAHMTDKNIRSWSFADIIRRNEYIPTPVWIISGLFLVFFGFHIMGEDEESGK